MYRILVEQRGLKNSNLAKKVGPHQLFCHPEFFQVFVEINDSLNITHN